MRKIYTANRFPLFEHTRLCRMDQYKNGNRQLEYGAVSEEVVTAVAAARDVDPLELPPLYNVIDPDALNQLFDHDVSGDGNGHCRVSFRMADCDVIVESNNEIDVTPLNERLSTSSAANHADELSEMATELE